MPPRRAAKRPPPGPSLFDDVDAIDPRAPLAARMRARTLEEFVGQEHIVGEGRPLRRAIESDLVPSCILWGPPGSGKTTLARIVARSTNAYFAAISAVAGGVADLRAAIGDAQTRRRDGGQRTILFIDEIHRFNKAQQDSVLPYVEDGTVTLIGATTENPSFEVIGPLLSRSRVFTLRPLEARHVRVLLERALNDSERGLGKTAMTVAEEALETLAELSGGDARSGLNNLELAVRDAEGAGDASVTVATIEAVAQRRLHYDKDGDAHFDTISAFIKSLRGSDPDAALYWLARMIESGEDPLFIVRRMVILAAEDIGLADPNALSVAMSAQQAVHFVGLPEGYLPLSQAVIYLALAPKSNSAMTSYQRALADVQEHGDLPVPLHLRNATTGLMKSLGYGTGYQYAHDSEDNVAEDQTHLPEHLVGRRYYQPGDTGQEPNLASGKRVANEAARLKAPPSTSGNRVPEGGSPHGKSRPRPPSPRRRTEDPDRD
ncbi:MAG TPA: replication-associated recombination protein A [Dehalococcoidia bacterium]|nr:replication-associated recombination protein A [Dehalococcoidia bacterium]